MTHWTTRVYRHNAHLLHDVEAAIFKNETLTDLEMEVLSQSAAALGTSVAEPILDLACGPGRHSIRFAQAGLAVTGIDLSEAFLRIARANTRAATRNGNRPAFACGDMRHLPTHSDYYRSVVLLGNSFGYFPEEQNLTILQEIHRSLAPGGFFCMEITDREAYLPKLQPYETESIDSPAVGTIESHWRKNWDAASQRVNTFESHRLRASGEVLYEGSYDLRLYGREEIGRLLRTVGFHSIRFQSSSPSTLDLAAGIGETLGAAGEVLFAAALK